MYERFVLGDTVSKADGGTFASAVAFSDGVTIDDDGATVLTVDRATSDGTIIDVQKDGTSVGNIGAKGGDLIIGTGDVGIRFHDANDVLRPTDQSTGSGRDNAIDIGDSSNRFKDAYLGGGLYVGGTVSANHLDDYEEGTFTATDQMQRLGATKQPLLLIYVKIGRLVHFAFSLTNINTTGMTSSNTFYIQGLPFNPPSGYNHYVSLKYQVINFNTEHRLLHKCKTATLIFGSEKWAITQAVSSCLSARSQMIKEILMSQALTIRVHNPRSIL